MQGSQVLAGGAGRRGLEIFHEKPGAMVHSERIARRWVAIWNSRTSADYGKTSRSDDSVRHRPGRSSPERLPAARVDSPLRPTSFRRLNAAPVTTRAASGRRWGGV